MNRTTLVATTRLGLESIVKEELIALGFDDLTVTNGRIEFEAMLEDIPRVNLWLRCADRVLLKMGRFSATTFDELYERTKALPWEDLVTEDGKLTVSGSSVKSVLRSVRSCQSIVNKAIVDRLRQSYQTDWLSESGPGFSIQFSLLRDEATLAVDTSGAGLHKRGYRADAVEAPLKETLAAALVKLSVWDRTRLLIDPMCGSGTILIEAALIARNIAPGLNRSFAAEGWPAISPHAWRNARARAKEAIEPGQLPQIYGYDVDEEAIEIARSNARIAAVGDDLNFETKDIRDLWIDREFGVAIANPPYGRRISDYREINSLYVVINKMFRKKTGWSVYILTADKKFPDYFKRSRPDRVRKLYNGPIKVNYYQYLATRCPG